MKLTFEEALEQHRKMWNWIADNVDDIKQDSAIEIKKMYLEKFFQNESISSACFCCDYNNYIDRLNCKHCPIIWGAEGDTCYHLYYDLFDVALAKHLYSRASEIARMIANLPAREKMDRE